MVEIVSNFIMISLESEFYYLLAFAWLTNEFCRFKYPYETHFLEKFCTYVFVSFLPLSTIETSVYGIISFLKISFHTVYFIKNVSKVIKITPKNNSLKKLMLGNVIILKWLIEKKTKKKHIAYCQAKQ